MQQKNIETSVVSHKRLELFSSPLTRTQCRAAGTNLL